MLLYEISKSSSVHTRKLSQQRYDLGLAWTFVAVMGRCTGVPEETRKLLKAVSVGKTGSSRMQRSISKT